MSVMQGERHSVSEGSGAAPSRVEQARGLEELEGQGAGGRSPNSGQGMPLKVATVVRRFPQAGLEGEHCRPRGGWGGCGRASEKESIRGTGRRWRGAVV